MDIERSSSRKSKDGENAYCEAELASDNQMNDKKVQPWVLEYLSTLLHLAVFGILGALTRYSLQKLVGPGVFGPASTRSYMNLDLPSNIVGSFLMGWWGVVFKEDISRVSNQLAVGLTTGYLGSLTTFSAWNQEMLDLGVHRGWRSVVLGYFLGLVFAVASIFLGVGTALGCKWLLKRLNLVPSSGFLNHWKEEYKKHEFAVVVLLFFVLGLLWSLSGILEAREFRSGSIADPVWLGCVFGPFGVWGRWFLARLNARGLGKGGMLKWMPFGTLLANVSASGIMAALATLQIAVKTKACFAVAHGLQFGLCGCLSTVSTFMAEWYAMILSEQPWRAFVYAWLTIVISFGLGILVFAVPVWAKFHQ